MSLKPNNLLRSEGYVRFKVTKTVATECPKWLEKFATWAIEKVDTLRSI
jgi:hypothetical protein